ncbi:MAG TPA: hypothetical protein DCP97_05875, partial [Ruminococcaceae bacterium]|nr:hypothetical protein [Oscillospiraceae bacterium]
MAATKKRTTGGRAGSSRGKSSATATAKKQRQESKAAKQFWAIILFALGIFIGCVTAIEGASAWFFLHSMLRGIFGWSAYIIAPIFIYIAVMAALDKPIGIISNKVWQTLALIVLICGATQIFGTGIPQTDGMWKGIV